MGQKFCSGRLVSGEIFCLAGAGITVRVSEILGGVGEELGVYRNLLWKILCVQRWRVRRGRLSCRKFS